MKALLQGSFACRRSGDLPEVHVFDPHATAECDVCRRYGELFKPLGDRLHLVAKRFEHVVDGELAEVLTRFAS
jgi:hypothetical protein